MRKLTLTAAAVFTISTLLALTSAKADDVRGGPLSQNGQCFTYSVAQAKDARYGYWGACPQKASATIAPTRQQQTRRQRAASR